MYLECNLIPSRQAQSALCLVLRFRRFVLVLVICLLNGPLQVVLMVSRIKEHWPSHLSCSLVVWDQWPIWFNIDRQQRIFLAYLEMEMMMKMMMIKMAS